MGEVSARQGNVSLTQGQVFTDSIIQLTGDETGSTHTSECVCVQQWQQLKCLRKRISGPLLVILV